MDNRGLDLEKELTCYICTEVLYQPLTLLDCLHTFCGSCLKEWFSWQLTALRKNAISVPSDKNPYTCPSCRAPVRETKHNATVTTLLEMFLAANPDKGRTTAEKEESARKYEPGDAVMTRIEEREKTSQERMMEDEDRRLVSEVQQLSLREAGVEARTTRRRRGDEGSRGSIPRSSRDNSRDSRERRSTEGRNTGARDSEGRDREGRDRRRRTEAEIEGRRLEGPSASSASLRPDANGSTGRRQRRSQEAARRRHEEINWTATRQIEHQSSLRSLISPSDVDSHEMEEEILRQIQEEGLLDGIDLDNIDVNQEDLISERIAEAFRRRQRERFAADTTKSRTEPDPAARNGHSSSSQTRDAVRSGTRLAARDRGHSRSLSASNNSRDLSRLSPGTSVARLDVQSSDEDSRRRRGSRTRSSGTRRSTSPVPLSAENPSRSAARSQTDLSDRPRLSQSLTSRPIAQSRSATDPTLVRPSESLPMELPAAQPILPVPRGGLRSRTIARSEGSSTPMELPAPSRRAAAPSAIFVPSSGPSTAPHSSPHQSPVHVPISPRNHQTTSAVDRASAISSASSPISVSTASQRSHLPRFPEPSIICSRCAKPHIEYELHYNCYICLNGEWNICLPCYRAGRGCLHWFGFGQAAWAKWERQKSSGELSSNAERPHMLTANRYMPPKAHPGGADGRRTITSEDPQGRLQSGAFCANCSSWANECFWKCDVCNESDWGFCNTCVNQGKCCTHALLPLIYKPDDNYTSPVSPIRDHATPSSASILTGPGVVTFGNFKPLIFRVDCDICHHSIQPSASRYHCFSCTSTLPNRSPGDYDICTNCYTNLVSKKRISPENGHSGWRRCLQGHRTIIVRFQDIQGGQRRVIVQDLVGGCNLHEEPAKSLEHSGLDLQQWSWAENTQTRLVTTDVTASAPTSSNSLVLSDKFPPDGGLGMRALALWSWYPKEGEGDNELLFPRGAELRECVDVNGDWYFGVYMGAKGLYPAPYVTILASGL